MKTVLIAEDEGAIREFITINLAAAGYEVIEAENGIKALELFAENQKKIDIALIDIMMPGLDGFEVCRKIRELSAETGVIFLSAKTQEEDKLCGFNSGADDYITKPFSISELLARIDSLYRRIEFSRKLLSEAPKDTIALGDYELDLKNHFVYHKGNKIELTQIEFQILQCFFTSPDKSIDRNSILKKVWGDPYYGDDKVVDVNIRRLRIKLENDPSSPEHLITVWGQGYRWIV
ncbi:MAG: response regulator transcription factor [Ruminococcaceae bacterium]|nr:response regulator transcription factor [Oscillospiraceae bacterium]